MWWEDRLQDGSDEEDFKVFTTFKGYINKLFAPTPLGNEGRRRRRRRRKWWGYTTYGGGRGYIEGYEWCKCTNNKGLSHFLWENIKNTMDTIMNFRLILK